MKPIMYAGIALALACAAVAAVTFGAPMIEINNALAGAIS